MAISTVYGLHGIINSATFLSQISNARVTPDMEYLVAQSAGLPFPLFCANMGVNPGVTFDTTQVKTVLDLTGALSSIVDLSGANTDLHFKKFSDLGRRVADATAEHIRMRMSQAWLSLGQITAGHNSEASASVKVGTTYDGTNAPIVPAGTLALAGTPTSAEHFVAGPVKVNTVSLPGVESITIDFGRQVMESGADGELYKTFAAQQFYSPVVTIRGFTQAWSTYGLNGTTITALSVWLRKVDDNGRVADATTEHILFSGTAGIITVDETSGGNNEPAMTTVRCTLIGANSTTEPITVSTAAAIS
jgi:hypothetical protein